MGAAALPILDQLWRASDGGLPTDQRALELTRLTLAAPALDPDLLIRAAEAAARWLYRHGAGRATRPVRGAAAVPG